MLEVTLSACAQFTLPAQFGKIIFFFSSRGRHTRWPRDWSSDVCSSDLAVMNRGASWVRAKYKAPDARATNGCGDLVTRCQNAFALPNTTWWQPPQDCPAALVPRQRVTTSADCEAVIGAGCDTQAPAESARLLRHEHGHYNIACKL